MKLLLCFGTRPEAIKMAPVVHELKRKNVLFQVCVTAQHRQMLDQVLEFFEIKPDYDLNLMKAGQSLNELSGNILGAIDKVFDDWLGPRQPQPGFRQLDSNIVLVHGDTTTASMIAQAAFHRQIKVGHVEAGLRTFNKQAPFPEEINRQIIGKIADFHFAPTAKAKANLLSEQIAEKQIVLTGNTVVDALKWARVKIDQGAVLKEIENFQSYLDPHKKLILVTGHRRENFGKGLEEICKALLEIASKGQTEIIYPVHLNPKVVSIVERMLGNKTNIHLISPVSYPTMLWLIKRTSIIISDSGGIQEEAPAFGKPVLVTRMVSERMEGVEAGFSVLVGTNKTKIVAETNRLLLHPPDFKEKINPYGDGKAAARIVDFLSAQEESWEAHPENPEDTH